MRWSSRAFVSGLIVATSVAIGAPVAAQVPVDDLEVAPIVVQLCCAPTAEKQLVTGRSWTPGVEIDLLVNGEGVATAVSAADGSVTFDLDATGVIVEGDDVVEFVRADGTRSERHVVRPLVVSRMDAAADGVSGTAGPGSSVVVFVPGTVVVRVVTADVDGRWTADLSTPGPGADEGAVFDVRPLSVIAAAQLDEDGNATLWEAQAAEYAPIIVFVAGADLAFGTGPQVISGQSWGIGDEVALSIDDVFVATSIAEQNAEGSATPFFDLAALGVSVSAGDEVTLTVGSRTQSHVVTALEVTDVDLDADTVTGTAAPGTAVLLEELGVGRFEVADGAGDWLADFSVPGDEPFEQAVTDLVADSIGLSVQFDDAGNGTMVAWAAQQADKQACKEDGWQQLGFRNQGQCVKVAVAQP